MTLAERTFMERQPHKSRASDLGREIGAALKRRYPHHTAKLVAADMKSTVKAAENLLDGHLSARSATRLIEAYGPGFMAEAVMAAAGTTLKNHIIAQAERARQEAVRQGDIAREHLQLAEDLVPPSVERPSPSRRLAQ